MGRNIGTENISSGGWSVLTHHDWNDDTELLSRLADGLESLESAGEPVVLHDHVEIEAILDAFDTDSEKRRVTEVRFECEENEIKITKDGTIEYRPLPSGGERHPQAPKGRS